MPDAVRRIALGQVLRRVSEQRAIVSGETYKQVTVRLYGKGLVLRDEVDGAEIAASSRVVVREGQFLLSKIDARHGAFGLVPADLDGSVVTNDFPAFEVDESLMDRRYLGWLARTESFVDMCRRASKGSTNRVRLQEEAFLSEVLLLPDVEEQRRVVARIEAVAERVAAVRSLRASVEADVSALLSALNREASSAEEIRLGEVLELHEEKEQIQVGSLYPQVGVRAYGRGLFESGAVVGGATTYRTFNKLYEDAIVLSQVKGWEGAIARCSSDFAGLYASPEYRTFRCIDGKADPLYIGTLVRDPSFHARVAEAVKGIGARRERVRPERFLDIRLALPSYEEQGRIAKAMMLHEATEAMVMEQDGLLASLLASTLDAAFAGRL